MKVREALAEAARRLAEVSETPRLDAELLMAASMSISRNAMLLFMLEEEGDWELFDYYMDRRASHEPIAYITGRRAFWTIELEVGPGVLIPRPDSETLIEAALDRFGDAGPARILDLGTGPGTLLLAALSQWPLATGVGIDRSGVALDYAGRNAARLGLADRASFRLGDWGEGLDQRFELVLCNPPYIEAGARLPRDVAGFEPAEALFAGLDGLDAYRLLAPQIARLLAPGGLACVEIGAGQKQEVTRYFEAEGFIVSGRKDLAGHVRCLLIQP